MLVDPVQDDCHIMKVKEYLPLAAKLKKDINKIVSQIYTPITVGIQLQISYTVDTMKKDEFLKLSNLDLEDLQVLVFEHISKFVR